MISTDQLSINITKVSVKAANPQFFCESMMKFIGTTDADWDIVEWNNHSCLFVKRPASQAIACYVIHPLTLKLVFWCHIGHKLTRI